MTAMRSHLTAIFFTTASLFTASAQKKEPSPPNVIFILANDLGWQDCGFTGAKFFETPHLDKFASEGMNFTRAYSGGPNCAPTRACLMSGTHTPRHRICTPGGATKGKPKYMRLLVPSRERQDKALNEKAATFEITNSLDPKVVCIPEVLEPAACNSARIGKWRLGPDTQGFDLSTSNGNDGVIKNHYGDVDVAEELTDRALIFIEDNHDGQFFLYLAHFDVRTPHRSRKEVAARYEDKLKALPKEQRENFNPVYAGMIDAVDTSVGQVVNKVDELGISGNTLIIFSSDNGGSHRFPS